MGQQVCMGAMTRCNMGAAPSSLVVLPTHRVLTGMPAANILDHKPLINVLPFGMCKSLGNPLVAAATAASMGALKPMPCIPMTTSPWLPGSPKVLIANSPALNKSSRLVCNWGGMITLSSPGQVTVSIP